TNLGFVELRLGHVGRAGVLFAEAVRYMRERGAQRGLGYGLAGCAGLAIVRGNLVQGVRLAAAAVALFAGMGVTMDGTDRRDAEYFVERARAALDPAAFTAAWAAGERLTIEQAIAEALAVATEATAGT